MKTEFRYLFLSLIIFSLINCSGLPKKPKNNIPKPPKIEVDVECEKMEKKAIKDFNNGIREYNYLGLVIATKFEVYYSDYMKREYNIIIKASCTANYLEDCYSEIMNDEIERKYGLGFMEKTRKKAKRKFKKNNKTE